MAVPAGVLAANAPATPTPSTACSSSRDLSLGFRRGWTHGVLAMAVLPLVLTVPAPARSGGGAVGAGRRHVVVGATLAAPDSTSGTSLTVDGRRPAGHVPSNGIRKRTPYVLSQSSSGWPSTLADVSLQQWPPAPLGTALA